MPINLYVISTQDFTGKSAVCVALMQRMQQDGYSVGYLKPVSSIARVLGESGIDEDARLVKETFNYNETNENEFTERGLIYGIYSGMFTRKSSELETQLGRIQVYIDVTGNKNLEVRAYKPIV